jgi:hypothetical protein
VQTRGSRWQKKCVVYRITTGVPLSISRLPPSFATVSCEFENTLLLAKLSKGDISGLASLSRHTSWGWLLVAVAHPLPQRRIRASRLQRLTRQLLT